MKSFLYQTKMFITGSKKINNLYIFLNIVFIIALVLSVVSIFMFGIGIANGSTIVLATVLIFRVKSLVGGQSKYEQCFAQVTMEDTELVIHYYRYYVNNQLTNDLCEVRIAYDSINEIEYSDKLSCMRLCGAIQYSDLQHNEQFLRNEHLLYISDADAISLYNAIKEKTGIRIRFIDR